MIAFPIVPVKSSKLIPLFSPLHIFLVLSGVIYIDISTDFAKINIVWAEGRMHGSTFVRIQQSIAWWGITPKSVTPEHISMLAIIFTENMCVACGWGKSPELGLGVEGTCSAIMYLSL